ALPQEVAGDVSRVEGVAHVAGLKPEGCAVDSHPAHGIGRQPSQPVVVQRGAVLVYAVRERRVHVCGREAVHIGEARQFLNSPGFADIPASVFTIHVSSSVSVCRTRKLLRLTRQSAVPVRRLEITSASTSFRPSSSCTRASSPCGCWKMTWVWVSFS